MNWYDKERYDKESSNICCSCIGSTGYDHARSRLVGRMGMERPWMGRPLPSASGYPSFHGSWISANAVALIAGFRVIGARLFWPSLGLLGRFGWFCGTFG